LNITQAASVRLLASIKARIVSIADPFLLTDDNNVRDLAAQVFITIMKRMNEPNYTESLLNSSFLSKLDYLIKQDDQK
jgi:hypothetical protein